MFKLLVILDVIKLDAQINVHELIVNWYWIQNLLEDLNPSIKSKIVFSNLTICISFWQSYLEQMITDDNSDARIFLINETNHLTWLLYTLTNTKQY